MFRGPYEVSSANRSRFFESSCGDHQQKRGWTGPLERAVSIRSRRVHSPLLREWGPKARPSRTSRRVAAVLQRGPVTRDERQIVLRFFSGAAALTRARQPEQTPASCRPIRVGAQYADGSLAVGLEPRRQDPEPFEVIGVSAGVNRWTVVDPWTGLPGVGPPTYRSQPCLLLPDKSSRWAAAGSPWSRRI